MLTVHVIPGMCVNDICAIYSAFVSPSECPTCFARLPFVVSSKSIQNRVESLSNFQYQYPLRFGTSNCMCYCFITENIAIHKCTNVLQIMKVKSLISPYNIVYVKAQVHVGVTFIIQYIVLVYVIAQVHVGVTFIIQYIVLVYVIAQVHVGVAFIIQYIVLVYVIAQVHVGVAFIIQYIVLVYVIAQVHVGVTFII